MKTILFDFGNVIAFFDHQRAVRQLVQYTPLTAAELTAELYNGQLEDDYEAGKLNTAEYFAIGKREAKLTCSQEEFLAAFVDIFTGNPEVCELIPRLKTIYRLVLASNTNEAHFAKYTEQFDDVLRYFDHLCPSQLAKVRKPNAGYFEYCQQFVAAEPGECVFVDDMAVNVEAARKFGWKAIQYRPDGTLPAQLRAAGVLFD